MIKIIMKIFVPMIFGVVILLTSSQVFSQSLKVGDPAPAIRAMAWIKGKPVEKYTPGQVYVVEFWATWCIPCKENIPGLSAMAKKYAGKLTVVGVDVRENEVARPSIDLVKGFVARMEDKMNYTVAMDDPSRNLVFKDWMEAAGMQGIPTAFVVNQSGRIAWVGHPVKGGNQLEDAVAMTLAGTLNLDSMKLKQQQTFSAERAYREHTASSKLIRELLVKKDYQALKQAALKNAADVQPNRQQLAVREAFAARIFLEPDLAREEIKKLLANSNTREFPDFLYFLQEFADLMPAFVVDPAIEILRSGSEFSYRELAAICYRIGKNELAVDYINRYIAWKKKYIDNELKLIEVLELLRAKYQSEKTKL